MHRSQTMLSVGMSAGAGYYMEAQAEYYLGGTEPTGVWWNLPGHFGYRNGAAVDPFAFKALHAGFSPRDDRPLVQNAGADKRRGGYDLTFSADKSISALWAVAPAAMRAEIEAAQEEAVRAALVLMQERAAETRRGRNGTIRELVALFGALFQHGDTRAGDPDLHTHAVILNVAQRQDGSWGSVANEKLYQWKMAAGALYRAALAEQLQKRLGVGIEHHGNRLEFIRIQGVPDALCQAWSKRRRAITAEAAALGFSTDSDAARAAGLAVATRGKKGYAEGREARWLAEAAAQGWGGEQAHAVTGQAQGNPADRRNQAWERLKARVRETVEQDSVFTEQKLWQVAAEAAAGAFPARDIGGLVTRLQAEGVVVRLPGEDERGRVVYSTREAVEDEVAVRALARQAAQGSGLAVIDGMARWLIQRSDIPLSNEQAEAAHHAMSATGGLVLVEGAPGVGKSTLLKPVVTGYRMSGATQILACAVAWRQARSLGEGIAADESLAAAALLSRWRTGALAVDARTVLVVDELGQWSARQARTLMELQRATGCRVVGVGDRRQLQPIGAGPGMRLLTREVEPVIVDTIIRQSDAAARAAVRAVLEGDAAAAVAAHRQRGHIVETSGPDAAVAAVADRLMQARAERRSTIAIAETWHDVRAISAAVRAQLRANGALGQDALTITASGSRPGQSVMLSLAVGDELRFRHRDDRLGVVNGDTGRVLAIAGTVVTVETAGRRIAVDTTQYLDKDGLCPLAHAYASTLAAAQGVTVEAPILLSTDRLTKQAATVALSRGVGWTTVVVDRTALEEEIRAGRVDEAARIPVTAGDIDAHLARAWSRDVEKVSALDYLDSATVEDWVAGWTGTLPTTALSPSGQPVAEVVDLAHLRAHRQHAENRQRLAAAGARLAGQAQALANHLGERVWSMASRLVPLGARLEAQGQRLRAEQSAEAEALTVLTQRVQAGAAFHIGPDQRRTIDGLSDADVATLRQGWTERVANEFDRIAADQARAIVERQTALEAVRVLTRELFETKREGHWGRAGEIEFGYLPSAMARLAALDPAAAAAEEQAAAEAWRRELEEMERQSQSSRMARESAATAGRFAVPLQTHGPSRTAPAPAAAAPTPPIRDLSLEARNARANDLVQRTKAPEAWQNPLAIYLDAHTQYYDNDAACRVEDLSGAIEEANHSERLMQILAKLCGAAAQQVLHVPAAREAARIAGRLAEIEEIVGVLGSSPTPDQEAEDWDGPGM
ncbi:hypothetical protein VY88_28185 [Azospirillum thiophilum]|uniref:TrwC relaxase domain-containing protein n=2 Tax=Azospirillum thiophilum TaxID=528244 RepID=A0AAC8W630_9PROT|nr:hypothetical protein AL072_31510 [Azospirillum thiophilum]KJR62020.1 hypothetical protein VY88_28185 [Azospirillum thiophilum]